MRNPILHFLIGIPASGKSTYASSLMNSNQRIIYVNRDSIRLSLLKGASRWNHSFEEIVKEVETVAVRQAIKEKFSVIIDSTNLPIKRYNYFKSIADQVDGIEFQPIIFSDSYDLSLCLHRNQLREGSARIPHSVIETMYEQFLLIDKSSIENHIVI